MPATGRLFLGTRRYSSWSMRGWLAVRLAGLDIAEEIVLPISGTGNTPDIKAATPSGLVPYLEHHGNRVWESLAIIEYCAEFAPALWPASQPARAHARSIAAEMHAGFRALRQAMPMNLGLIAPPGPLAPEVLADIARMEQVWAETRAAFGGGGPFLFGTTFNGADAMFAPIVARFLSYRPTLSDVSHAYCAAVRAHPLVDAWYRAADLEPLEWRLDKYEHPPAR